MFIKKFILSIAILIGNCAIQVKAATYTVTKLADTADGICNADCSLREAIGVANSTVDDDVIYFAAGVTGTITVSSTLIINSTPNIGLLTINGPTIGTGIKVSGNNATRVFSIRSATTVELNFLTISDGLSSNGSGIDNQGILTINNSTISNNTATFVGGGISNGGPDPILLINNSTISGNTVTAGGANQGGGIFAFSGTVTLNNSTVSNNSAASVGGVRVQTTLNLRNTIIGNNGGSNGDCSAATTNATFNLVESGNCITNGVNNNIVADAMLGPLQDNGGSTFTHAILPGSLAINTAIDCTDTAAMAVTIDQRGTNRPQNGICDIGSFEATGTFRTLTITASGPASGTVTDASGVLIDCTVTAGVTSLRQRCRKHMHSDGQRRR